MGIAMDMVLVAVVGVVLLALLFDFTNGFHDAANSTSTVVATRAMKPRHAVYMAAFFNFAALFVVGTAVANTVAKTVQVEALGVQSGGVPSGSAWRSAPCSARSSGTTSPGRSECRPRRATP